MTGGRGAVVAGALLAVAAALALAVAAAGAPGRTHVSVYFVQGEQLAPVSRRGTTALDAARQLVTGPHAPSSAVAFAPTFLRPRACEA